VCLEENRSLVRDPSWLHVVAERIPCVPFSSSPPPYARSDEESIGRDLAITECLRLAADTKTQPRDDYERTS
jgi:hypothetical protein